MPSFEAGAQLLSSLSGYAYTKRAWRKEVFELFMDPLFFTMDASCAPKLVFVRRAEIDLDATLLQVHNYGTFKSDWCISCFHICVDGNPSLTTC